MFGNTNLGEKKMESVHEDALSKIEKSVFYNANSDVSNLTNRQNAMKYLMNHSSSKDVMGLVRYYGGYHSQYIMFGADDNRSSVVITEINTYPKSICYWMYYSGSNTFTKVWEVAGT